MEGSRVSSSSVVLVPSLNISTPFLRTTATPSWCRLSPPEGSTVPRIAVGSLWSHIHTYADTYTRARARTHTHTHTLTYIHTHTYIYIYIYIYIYYIYIFILKYIYHTYRHTCIESLFCIYLHSYMHAYTHMCTRTHMHTPIHTYT